MVWSVLGIEPTKDKKAITAAYRGKLKDVNPEDKPEQFKALRAAYEEALRLAQTDNEEQPRDESPLGLWKEKLEKIYRHFPSRIDPKCWKELFEDEFCVSIDGRAKAEEALLRFFMQDYYIPCDIWRLIDSVFSLTKKLPELYESYPRDFVDYVILNGVRYEDSLPYELFIPGQDAAVCDEYRKLYYEANRTDFDELEEKLLRLEEMKESHPYGEALRCRWEMEKGDGEQGRNRLDRLCEQYPEDCHLNMRLAAVYARDEKWSEAERLARRILSVNKDHWQAKSLLADALAVRDEQEDAKSLIFELMHAAGGDNKVLAELGQTVSHYNEALIERYKKKLEEDGGNDELRIKLAWCLLQNERAQEAQALCGQVRDYEDAFDYHQLCAKVSKSLGNNEAALAASEKVEEIIKNLQEDGTEKTAKRMKRLPEFLQLSGSSLLELGRREEALEKFEQSVQLAPDDAEILTRAAQCAFFLKRYEQSVDYLVRLTELMPGSYHGHFLLSQVYFELGRDRDAFESVNKALNIEHGDLGVYTHKMRILLRNGVYDETAEILSFLEQNQVGDYVSVCFCRAQLTEFGDKDKEKALEQYYEVAERVKNGENFTGAAELYLRIAVLEGETLDIGKEDDRKFLLEILEKGLEQDKEHRECLDYKAWILKRAGRNEEALEIYHRLEKLPRRSLNVERELAELYYGNLNKNAKKALYYYKKLLSVEESAELHFYVGSCYRWLRELDKAEAHYLREKELNEGDIDAYHNLAYIYEAKGEPEKALENADKALELSANYNNDKSPYYLRRIQILRRLRRPYETMAGVDLLAEKTGAKGRFIRKFGIACQFGLFDEAEKLLKAWKRSGEDLQSMEFERIELSLYRAEVEKARREYRRRRERLGSGDAETLALQFAELDGDTQYLEKYWLNKAKDLDSASHEYLNLAESCCWAGDMEKARYYAGRALEDIEKALPENKRYELLYICRRAMALTILGRLEEADAEFKRIASLPLCEHCEYCACKDAQAFEAMRQEVLGNNEKALELYRKGRKDWPDELDFLSGERRVLRRGKRK